MLDSHHARLQRSAKYFAHLSSYVLTQHNGGGIHSWWIVVSVKESLHGNLEGRERLRWSLAGTPFNLPIVVKPCGSILLRVAISLVVGASRDHSSIPHLPETDERLQWRRRRQRCICSNADGDNQVDLNAHSMCLRNDEVAKRTYLRLVVPVGQNLASASNET